MAEQVHLFLEEEQVEAIEHAVAQNQAGESDLPPAVLALLQYILMWKEPA
jgi:hypothetical protein